MLFLKHLDDGIWKLWVKPEKIWPSFGNSILSSDLPTGDGSGVVGVAAVL